MAAASSRSLGLCEADALPVVAASAAPERLETAIAKQSAGGWKRPLLRYGVSIAGLLLATIFAVVLHHFGERRMAPFSTVAFLILIMASAWWGGYCPGILVCLLSIFAVPFALHSHFDPTKVDPVRLLLLLLISLVISRVAQSRNKIEAELREANESLEGGVRRRTAELQRTNSELMRLNEDLNQFAYSVSHDLQEPLRMIAIYSDLLERKHKSDLAGDAGQYVHNIAHGARRMDLLLKDLLAYVQAVKQPLEIVGPVDGTEMLTRALSNLSAAVSQAHAVVTHGTLPRVRVEPLHLLLLFQNLIGNAIKYRGDEAPRINVSAKREDCGWTICVQDNGIGIPAQYSHQLFRMFKRLHNSAKYEGTGMGLAICQRIVQRYGGRIWVESEEGKGSRFFFTLPAMDAKSAAAHA